MYIEEDKPHVPPEPRDNPIGVVLDAFIEVDNKRQHANGSVDQQVLDVKAVMDKGLADVEQFGVEVLDEITLHTAKKGAVHGETKTTVGLDKHSNWPMATLEEHKAGTSLVTYVHPLGLKELVNARVKVDPKAYIPARSLPFAFGGMLGEVPQIKYNFDFGEFLQSSDDPINHIADTPFHFATPSGMLMFPTMIGANTIGCYTPIPGERDGYAATEWGSSKVRIYNNSVDVHRGRPSVIKGNLTDKLGDVIKVSEHLWDRTHVSYMNGTDTHLRSFNKNRLPFDVFSNGSTSLYKGIFESREEYLYNFTALYRTGFGLSSSERSVFDITMNAAWPRADGISDVIPALPPPTTDGASELKLMFQMSSTKLLDRVMMAADGPDQPMETRIGSAAYDPVSFNLPVNSKIKRFVNDTGSVRLEELHFDIRDLLDVTNDQVTGIITNFNPYLSDKISFAWRNRLLGVASVCLSMSWWTADRKKYISGWMSFDMYIKHTTGQVTVDVTTQQYWNLPKQKVDANLEPIGEGIFKSYTPDAKNDPIHPLVVGGVFDQQGGHLKVYTLYNRQYIAHYSHAIEGALSFNDRDPGLPVPISKFTYTPQSTINNDGFYGDHLRHIPVKRDPVNDEMTYLTQSRDWRNRYRWAFSKIRASDGIVTGRPRGDYVGPKRTGLKWKDLGQLPIPSFCIESEDVNGSFNTSMLVFTTDSKYVGYAGFTVNEEDNMPAVTFSNPISIHDEILQWISTNAGTWIKNSRLFFMSGTKLYYFNQCVDADELIEGEDDCYFGVIKDCIIHEDPNTGARTVRASGDISSSITVQSIKVNTRETLQIDHATILGYDPLVSQDVHIHRLGTKDGVESRVVMVNLAPFNNFYFEFVIEINTANGNTVIRPYTESMDPVFRFDPVKGFNVKYDELIEYGTKIPHRLHINYQSPVNLPHGMWSFRKTPNQFGFFTERYGQVVINGGVMSSIPGLCVYPVGSILTVNGKNTFVKEPVNFYRDDFNKGAQELFVRIENAKPLLYSYQTNPLNFDTQPTTGATPAGFMKGDVFSYHDQDSWRNSLTPVIDNKRLNIYGYGQSFGVFLGKPGSGLPVNRFYRDSSQESTNFTWNTAVGRVIPATPSTKYLRIAGSEYVITPGVAFTIPVAHTGIVSCELFGVTVFKWGAGLVSITRLGDSVEKLDFAGSSTFTFATKLNKRVTSLAGAFRACVGASYPGLNELGVEHVKDFTGCFMDSQVFNQALPGWNFQNAETIESMYENTKVFNQPINIVGYHIRSVAKCFKNTQAFNQVMTLEIPGCTNWTEFLASSLAYNKPLPDLVFPKGTILDSMFKSSRVFNSSLNNLDYSGVTSMISYLQAAAAFNQPVTGWNLGNLEQGTYLFSAMPMFNQPINVDFGSDESKQLIAGGMWEGCQKFNQDIKHLNWVRCTQMDWTLKGCVLFNKDLTGMATRNVETFGSMLRDCASFNSSVDGLVTSKAKNISNMLRGCATFNRAVETWDVSGVEDMQDLFNGAGKFNQPVGLWRPAKCRFFNGTFLNCSVFNQNLNDWPMESAESVASMFARCSMYNQDMDKWKLTSCTLLRGFIELCIVFNSKLPTDFGYPTETNQMFHGCTVFNQPVAHIRMENVIRAFSMFEDCRAFNQDVSNYDMRKVTSLSKFFTNCVLFDGDVSKWRPMANTDLFDTFRGCVKFNSNVNDWPVDLVTSFINTFGGCVLYNQPMNKWNVISGTHFAGTFTGCVLFNQDITMWITANAIIMSNTFQDARAFNRNLSTWNVAKVTSHTDFALGATAWTLPKPNFPT